MIRTFLFDPKNDPEKSARQKLMLYLPWRNEHVDLYSEFETYTEHYDAIKTQLACKISDFEPYANEVEMAEQFAQAEDIQEQWDLLVPGVEHAERTAADAETTESEAHTTINPVAHGQDGAFALLYRHYNLYKHSFILMGQINCLCCCSCFYSLFYGFRVLCFSPIILYLMLHTFSLSCICCDNF